jgi:hypothetical protein
MTRPAWDRYHPVMDHPVSEVAPGVFRVRDTCKVDVVPAERGGSGVGNGAGDGGERTGIAIDFGSGMVLDHLAETGIRIHVPPVERDRFAAVDETWRTRPVVDDDNVRQDRFSLLEPVPVADVVPEYRSRSCGSVEVSVLGRRAQRWARLAVDVRIGDLHPGQHAEALVDAG